jgi:uncharacterized protein
VDTIRLRSGAVTRATVSIVVVAALVAGGCGDDGEPSTPTEPSPGIANPASVYCEEQGGVVEIIEEPGGQRGDCILPDGTRIDEWEFFRQETGATIPDE